MTLNAKQVEKIKKALADIYYVCENVLPEQIEEDAFNMLLNAVSDIEVIIKGKTK